MAEIKNVLTVKIRLFSGLDKDVDVDAYDREEGITLNVPKGTRLKKVVKMIGLSDRYALVYFIHGERIRLRPKKLLEINWRIGTFRSRALG